MMEAVREGSNVSHTLPGASLVPSGRPGSFPETRQKCSRLHRSQPVDGKSLLAARRPRQTDLARCWILLVMMCCFTPVVGQNEPNEPAGEKALKIFREAEE